MDHSGPRGTTAKSQYQPSLPWEVDPCPPTRSLPPASGAWRLDDKTRRAGRLGVAAARAALAGTGRTHDDGRAHAA
ncbi:MAG TPA: hypothetical protein VMF60_10240 [Acidimicrobiales bacterium]|nr:hypothetical protein [Acidimicrobiales bacterium]